MYTPPPPPPPPFPSKETNHVGFRIELVHIDAWSKIETRGGFLFTCVPSTSYPFKKKCTYIYIYFVVVNCSVEGVLCMVSIQKVCYDWNAAAAWSCGDGGRCRETASPPAYRGLSPHLYLEHKTALFVSDKSYIYKCMYLLQSCLILSLCECVCVCVASKIRTGNVRPWLLVVMYT